ncbi:MAG TPA: cysteine desulfurase, partial [Tepidisphaeraceae bacterium]|nr:cysteine desulfurase [Tepidisphaeraceae bacterium]
MRAAFPILRTLSHGRPLVYLDNGATTQKPQAVIDAITRFYEQDNANIHRGVYELSQRATDGFEGARSKVRAFLNAAEDAEIIFVRGVTEAVNLVATSWGRANLRTGDEVLISAFEHHSGIVPWQMACAATGARLRVIPMDDAGVLDRQAYEKTLASGRVKMVSVAHVSNSLGTVNDVRSMARLAHAHGALVFVDGAQHVAHAATDVRAIDADFYAFSGHKLYGPTGIGVLYGKRALLEAMPPFLGGGDMIERVTFEQTTYAGLPNKFEAGTPDIAGAIGLGAAIDWISAIGMERIERAERELMRYALDQLRSVKGLRIVGMAETRSGAISFVIDEPKMAAHDVATLLDMDGIAVRSGHHCTQPVMDRLGVPATVRASIAIYNTREDIDRLVGSLKKITRMGAKRGARVAA